jgi:hypothetical protein
MNFPSSLSLPISLSLSRVAEIGDILEELSGK